MGGDVVCPVPGRLYDAGDVADRCEALFGVRPAVSCRRGEVTVHGAGLGKEELEHLRQALEREVPELWEKAEAARVREMQRRTRLARVFREDAALEDVVSALRALAELLGLLEGGW